jgi:hypothetical protein
LRHRGFLEVCNDSAGSLQMLCQLGSGVAVAQSLHQRRLSSDQSYRCDLDPWNRLADCVQLIAALQITGQTKP